MGIRSRKHQQMIAEFFSTAKDGKNSYVTLSLEGNISSGKSTFLQGIADHCPSLQNLIHVILCESLSTPLSLTPLAQVSPMCTVSRT